MSAAESLRTGKSIIKNYLKELHAVFDFPLETVNCYDVLESGDNFAKFRFDKFVIGLLEAEVLENQIRDKFNFSFFESEDLCWVRLESNGFECYIIAGLLAKIVSALKEAKKEFGK